MDTTTHDVNEKPANTLSDVATTSLLTLYCRAIESQSPDPIIQDAKAVAITRKLNPELAASKDRLLVSLAKGKIRKELAVHISLRAWKYDEYAQDFLIRHPDGIIVSIGCGMDFRFERVDNGRVVFFDLDLPEVMSYRQQFAGQNDRYHTIASSVFDYAWMDEIKKQGNRPVLFMAEGVFMYLDAEKVKDLVLTMQSRFPGSELVCEVVSKLFLNKLMKGMLHAKMRRQLYLGKDTDYHFGISGSHELETWHTGLKLIDDWCYFDTQHKKLGWLGWMAKSEFFRKVQWSIHYRLD
jgi:methyltransferase (TIGR00027 family)